MHLLLVLLVLTTAGSLASSYEPDSTAGAVEEYCLRGTFDLGARLQGLRPEAGERYPTTWCVLTEPGTGRVRFGVVGHTNSDVEGRFVVSYLAPDHVRIVNETAPPDIDFIGTLAGNEARAVRRIDPQRLVEELDEHPEWVVAERGEGWRALRWPGSDFVADVLVTAGMVREVRTTADLPLRGRVPVVWKWSWSGEHPDGKLSIVVDSVAIFEAVGSRRQLPASAAATVWLPSGGATPHEVPGKAWPAVVQMRVETLRPGVHMVRGVRTGFHHLVVETADGLVVADAPAGWVELHQLPPADLVPGLGISGLSQRFVDFLGGHWPGVPIRAVVLTHAHDDHAGGARAFAAAGAAVYAPAEQAAFLERALNSPAMPADRLSAMGATVQVVPVRERMVLPDPERAIELIPMGHTPHVDGALGIYVPSALLFYQSDLHVPQSEAPAPRPDRLASECWFARWADETLGEKVVVYNSHSTVALPVAHLAGYLEDDACTIAGF